MDKVQNSQL